jgi:hypothetical protein
MGWVQIPGGLLIPNYKNLSGTQTALSTLGIIDATGEKVAWVGRVWTPNYGSKAIRKVSFRFGTVTKAGGSGLTLSLQNVSTSSGPPMQPDETQDETYAIATGDANFVSNTFYTTGNLSADRNVTHGDRIAVVLEFDGGGRLGADSVAVASLAGVSTGIQHEMSTVLKTGGTWATLAALPGILFEFSDGTFGTIDGGWVFSAITSNSFKQDSNPDEYGLSFSLAAPVKVDGLWCNAVAAATGDFDMVLYSGTTVLSGVSVDANTLFAAASGKNSEFCLPGQTELPIGTYIVAVKPTQTTSNVQLPQFDVAANGHLAVHPFGTSAGLVTRVNEGAWSSVSTTRWPFMGIRVSAISDGAGGSAGGYIY